MADVAAAVSRADIARIKRIPRSLAFFGGKPGLVGQRPKSLVRGSSASKSPGRGVTGDLLARSGQTHTHPTQPMPDPDWKYQSGQGKA